MIEFENNPYQYNPDSKPGFIVYKNKYKSIQLLSMEERGEIFTALFEYAISNKVPDFSGQSDSLAMQMLFLDMKGARDIDNAKYQKRCEKNSENGKKGGRPKSNRDSSYDSERRTDADIWREYERKQKSANLEWGTDHNE